MTVDGFDALVAEHWRALHLHCYRMLGSYHDAEEATQEAMLRAWRKIDTFEGRAPLRHWLYRIATTTCLNLIASRARQPVAAFAEVTWLQPYPDEALDPAVLTESRESVRLAFIAALQTLPATQRAILILRDVLAWPAAEVAELLETTAAVNSGLQRARDRSHATAERIARRPVPVSTLGRRPSGKHVVPLRQSRGGPQGRRCLYVLPGHTAGAGEGAEFVIFSPAEIMSTVDAHMAKRAQELFGAHSS